jgi:hypothetical protein
LIDWFWYSFIFWIERLLSFPLHYIQINFLILSVHTMQTSERPPLAYLKKSMLMILAYSSSSLSLYTNFRFYQIFFNFINILFTLWLTIFSILTLYITIKKFFFIDFYTGSSVWWLGIIKRHPIYFFPTHILTIILLIKNRHGLFHVFRVHIGPILGESSFTPDQKHPL